MNNLPAIPNNDQNEIILINLSAQEIIKNPQRFNEIIKETSTKLKEAKTSTEEIQNRGWFKKMFSSNTSDIAKILSSQNTVLTNFFMLLQVLSVLCKGNSILLLELIQSMDNGLDMSNEEQKNLYSFAKSYLQEAIENAKSEELREIALKKLLIDSKNLNEFKYTTEKNIEKIRLDIEESQRNQSRKMELYQKEIDDKFENYKKANKEKFNELKQSTAESIQKHKAIIDKDLNLITRYKIISYISIVISVAAIILAIIK